MIIIERLYGDAELPTRATEGSAGYDLRAYLMDRTVRMSDGCRQWDALAERMDGGGWRILLQPRVMALVPLGFRARLPAGLEAQIRPRSGAAFKKGLRIPNAPGTIDSDYPDEWMVMLENAGAAPVHVVHGERIAQMVVAKYEALPFGEGSVGITSSRTGGFGSTGS